MGILTCYYKMEVVVNWCWGRGYVQLNETE